MMIHGFSHEKLTRAMSWLPHLHRFTCLCFLHSSPSLTSTGNVKLTPSKSGKTWCNRQTTLPSREGASARLQKAEKTKCCPLLRKGCGWVGQLLGLLPTPASFPGSRAPNIPAEWLRQILQSCTRMDWTPHFPDATGHWVSCKTPAVQSPHGGRSGQSRWKWEVDRSSGWGNTPPTAKAVPWSLWRHFGHSYQVAEMLLLSHLDTRHSELFWDSRVTAHAKGCMGVLSWQKTWSYLKTKYNFLRRSTEWNTMKPLKWKLVKSILNRD